MCCICTRSNIKFQYYLVIDTCRKGDIALAATFVLVWSKISEYRIVGACDLTGKHRTHVFRVQANSSADSSADVV